MKDISLRKKYSNIVTIFTKVFLGKINLEITRQQFQSSIHGSGSFVKLQYLRY